MRRFATLVLAVAAAPAIAQGPGSGDVRTPPPAPPVDERALPGASPEATVVTVPESAAPADNRSRQASTRCAEQSGALREQCLLEQQGSAAGATSVPEPRTAPPPQNPR